MWMQATAERRWVEVHQDLRVSARVCEPQTLSCKTSVCDRERRIACGAAEREVETTRHRDNETTRQRRKQRDRGREFDWESLTSRRVAAGFGFKFEGHRQRQGRAMVPPGPITASDPASIHRPQLTTTIRLDDPVLVTMVVALWMPVMPKWFGSEVWMDFSSQALMICNMERMSVD